MDPINDINPEAGALPQIPMEQAPAEVPTEPIPADAPEASIPDEPGLPIEGDPAADGAVPSEPPQEAGGEMGDLPVDPSQWEETTIMEGVGSGEEHQDPFWRYENWGVEADADGKYEAYAIVDETPMMVEGGFESFEEAVIYLNENMNRKKLVGGEDSSEEPAEEAPKEEPKEESEEAPKEEPKEEKKEEPKEEKKEEPKEEPKEEKKEDTKPSKKSVSGADSTDSIRSMMGSYWSQRTHGVSNLPRTGVSMREVAKSKNPTAAVGGVRVRIGYDMDDNAHLYPKNGKTKGDEGSKRKIDPSVRNAMAPTSRGGKANLKAPDAEDVYDEPKGGNASLGVKPVEDIY